MTPTEFREYTSFVSSLKVGDLVMARWTTSGLAFAVKSEVIKISRKSLRVKMPHVIYHGSYHLGSAPVYQKDQEIVVPICVTDKKWSANNGAFPV
jgi:hypothetical protein